MAGFFSLGGGGGGGGSGRDHHHEATTSQHQQHQQDNSEDQTPNSNSLFLYRSSDQEIYNKGLELWQQYYHHQRLNQQQHQQHQDHHTLGVGVGPSSSTRRNNLINFSDDSSSSRSGFQVMRQGSGGGGAPGGMNCQDCGNQAKKDCPHMRCRTCCKSRGFQCTTHVKSTWVPAAKRRERQQQLTALQQQQQQQQQHLQLRGGSGSGDINHPKRHRENTGLEVENFPAEVNSAAVFRCVKVLSAMDEADQEQYAYQTAVNIGGHVFKGILYDQGLESQYNMSASAAGGESSSGGHHHHHHHHHQQQLNLITSMTDTDTTAIAGSSNQQVVANLLDPSLIYPAPLNAFMAGTQFFPPPRS